MTLKQKAHIRIGLVKKAKKDGAETPLEIFNYIIKIEPENSIKELWGAYHRLSEYLENVALELY